MSENQLWLSVLFSGPNPTRWKLLQETVSHALPKEEGLFVYVTPGELKEAREALPAERYTVGTWTLVEGRVVFDQPLSAEMGNLLIYGVTPFPADLVDALILGYRADDYVIGRIITHVHSGWCDTVEEAKGWYEGCIHFSDLVLIDSRDEVVDNWVRDILERYRKLHYPCHFDLVRRGLPKHPQWFFDSQPRRLSLVFDPDDLSGLGGMDYEIEGDEPEEDEDEDGEKISLDPYLSRNAAGEREKKVRSLPFES